MILKLSSNNGVSVIVTKGSRNKSPNWKNQDALQAFLRTFTLCLPSFYVPANSCEIWKWNVKVPVSVMNICHPEVVCYTTQDQTWVCKTCDYAFKYKQKPTTWDYTKAAFHPWPAVNGPNDLSPICSLLPKLPSQTQMVPMKLKRKLCYKGHYMYEYVRPENPNHTSVVERQ